MAGSLESTSGRKSRLRWAARPMALAAQRVVPEICKTALPVASLRHTSQPSTAPLACVAVWAREVRTGVVNDPSIDGMQGVRGSNPVSSRFSSPVAPATRSSHRSWVLLALGSGFPGDCLHCSPTYTLTPLTTRSRSASSHRCCLAPPPAPCRAAPAPRGSGISACRLLPILGVSRIAGCGNRYLPRSSPSLSLSLVLDRSILSLVQPCGADPPPSAGRPHVPPCRAAPTSTTCSSSATRGWSVVTAGVLDRATVADGLVQLCSTVRRPREMGTQLLLDNAVRNVSVARVMAPRAALVSARALSMTKSWMMAWKRSAVTATPAWRSLSA